MQSVYCGTTAVIGPYHPLTHPPRPPRPQKTNNERERYGCTLKTGQWGFCRVSNNSMPTGDVCLRYEGRHTCFEVVSLRHSPPGSLHLCCADLGLYNMPCADKAIQQSPCCGTRDASARARYTRTLARAICRTLTAASTRVCGSSVLAG